MAPRIYSPNCNVFSDEPAALPVAYVSEVLTDDDLATDIALKAKGCNECKVRKLCAPEVELIKGEYDGSKGNVQAKVIPGTQRLIQAGSVIRRG